MKRDKLLGSPARFWDYVSWAVAFLVIIAGGCGGDDNSSPDQGSKIIVEPNQKLSTAPHKFDIYRAVDADKAIVFLHGGGGTKEYSAYQLGIKRDPDNSNYDVANEHLLLDNKAIVVFPQGQAIQAAPTIYTWNNYATVSGQDDVQFIRDLVAYITTQFKVSRTCIVGHSMGGVMVSRIWCEAPELFDAFVSISGPPSEHFLDGQTPCTPTAAKPFLNIVGSQDGVLRNTDWEAQTWTINPVLTITPAFVDSVVIGDRYFLPTSVARRCSGTVQPGDADAVNDGALTTWSYCDGSIKLIRVETAGHTIESLQGTSGLNMLQLAIDFMNAQ